MTTAHRPTWFAARGAGANDKGNWSTGGQQSRQFSAKDMPGQLTMKYRQSGQNTTDELSKRDKLAELERAEFRAAEEKRSGRKALPEGPAGGDRPETVLMLKSEYEEDKVKRYDDRDDDDSEDLADDSDEDDSDDEEQALQMELEKIRKEREEVKKKKEAEEREEQSRREKEAAMRGNALLNPNASSQVKRRWDDDVVFKGQARSEPEAKKRFINDTIRNDFHRRFLKKYIK